MKLHTLTLCGLFAAAVSAQDAVPGVAMLEASLTPVQKIVAAGESARLTLRVKVVGDAEIDATLLQGMNLQVAVGDAKPASFGKGGSGKVAVAEGTVIERVLEVPIEAGSVPVGEMVPVVVEWPGLTGASTSLQVVPEQTGIDLAKLDMAKTKVMLITNYGTMTLSFLPDKAPGHVENFVKLSKQGFYDGTRFHRIIRGFMIQGGCPNTKEGATGTPGTGDPGYKIDAEFNDIRHVRGIVSMARSNDPNSAGCQFFVCHGTASSLNGSYTAFGKVDEGLEVLDKIANVAVTGSPSGELSVPREPVHLHRAVVLPAMKGDD
ncbi:MAG: peptidylprolyl isomerase [Planctomycetota bacterium]